MSSLHQMLFIVAGYPASGKSSLLLFSLLRRAAIFGQSLDAIFRSALRIEKPNERMPSQEKIDRGMWLTLMDLPILQKQPHLSKPIVLHLDLLLLAISTIRPRGPADLKKSALQDCFAAFLNHDALRHFDQVAVNTIQPPIETIASQWLKREKNVDINSNLMVQLKNELILVTPERRKIYDAICDAWLRSVEQKAATSIVTRP